MLFRVLTRYHGGQMFINVVIILSIMASFSAYWQNTHWGMTVKSIKYFLPRTISNWRWTNRTDFHWFINAAQSHQGSLLHEDRLNFNIHLRPYQPTYLARLRYKQQWASIMRGTCPSHFYFIWKWVSFAPSTLCITFHNISRPWYSSTSSFLLCEYMSARSRTCVHWVHCAEIAFHIFKEMMVRSYRVAIRGLKHEQYNDNHWKIILHSENIIIFSSSWRWMYLLI